MLSAELRKKSRCTDVDSPLFFPTYDSPSSTEAAKKICAWCPIRVECLRHAMENDELGVWGGTSEAERRSLKRPRVRTVCIGCGGADIFTENRTEICLACGLSWPI